MRDAPIDQASFAEALKLGYGHKADQFVVDLIFESVRNADMQAAKWWDAVGSHLEGKPPSDRPAD